MKKIIIIFLVICYVFIWFALDERVCCSDCI